MAKSIYTDKEVFIRELLSNCSDALEKQRYGYTSGQSKPHSEADSLEIQISTNAKDRSITIFDTGIGMTRDEVVENLGTIAKSGSAAFVESLNDSKNFDSSSSESIIGQFGVGFYSSFVVSNHVEVLTKSDSS